MMFNATLSNISVISWQSVLLVEETGENHRPATSHWQTGVTVTIFNSGNNYKVLIKFTLNDINSCNNEFEYIILFPLLVHLSKKSGRALAIIWFSLNF
jgi:hypothetical protein